MFHILNLATKELVQGQNEPTSFEAGEDAAREARYLTEITGIKHQPRKAGNCVDWQAREQARIDSGEYIVPECLLPYVKPEHYVHVSKDKPELLAYTKDDSKGRADMQTRITVARYLATFADIEEGSTQSDAICALYMEQYVPKQLLFATTPDEIEAVYTNYDADCPDVAESCMRGDAQTWESGVHPCRVYGAGDLAVAYLVNDSGETTDRALCWPVKKIYSRVYGSARLHDLLKNEGFCKSAYHPGGEGRFYGAKLLKINADPDKEDDDCWVMPYIDDIVDVRMEGDYFVIVPGSRGGGYDTRSTDGRTRDPQESSRYICERCEEGFRTDDEFRGVHVSNRHYSMQSWCECCVDNHAFYCDGAGDYFSEGCDSIAMYDGETWSELYFRDHGGTCAKTGDNYPTRMLQNVIVRYEGHTEELWCEDAIKEHAWECERSSRLYSNDIAHVDVTLRDGSQQIWSQQAVDDHGDELEQAPIPETLTIADRASLLTLAREPHPAQIELAFYPVDQVDLRGVPYIQY